MLLNFTFKIFIFKTPENRFSCDILLQNQRGCKKKFDICVYSPRPAHEGFVLFEYLG